MQLDPREQLRRAAARPSRYAPRLSELHSPPVDPDADLAEVADLSEVCRDSAGRIVSATMTARAFVSLAGRCPELRRVRLIGAAMILGEVVASPRFVGLEALSLAGCRVGDAGAGVLASLPPGLHPGLLTYARKAGLKTGDPIGSDLQPGFAGVSEKPGVKPRGHAGPGGLSHLNLNHNALTPRGIGVVAQSPHYADLQYLGIAGSRHDAILDAFGHVSSFDLTDCDLGPAGFLALTRRQFDALELAGCDLELADWGMPIRCRRLGLARNAIGDRGTRLLAESGTLDAVEYLDLGVNRLTAAALQSLAGRVPRLESLNLAGNFLGAQDWAILSDFAAFPSLRRVKGLPLR